MDINHPFANSHNLDKIKASADVILEISATEIYLGFCVNTVDGRDLQTDEEGWSIMQINTTGTTFPKTTTFKWAEGQCFYNLVFDQYATYNYKFKTF